MVLALHHAIMLLCTAIYVFLSINTLATVFLTVKRLKNIVLNIVNIIAWNSQQCNHKLLSWNLFENVELLNS